MRMLTKAYPDQVVSVTFNPQNIAAVIADLSRNLDLVGSPDMSDELMQVLIPDPSFVPTQESIDQASTALIAMQDDLNQIPATLAYIKDALTAATLMYPNVDRSLEMFAEMVSAYDALTSKANSLYDEWTAYQQLRMQQMALWSAAIAKMEHDLSWQAYVATNYGTAPGDIPREGKAARPRLLVKGLNDAH